MQTDTQWSVFIPDPGVIRINITHWFDGYHRGLADPNMGYLSHWYSATLKPW